MGWIEVIGTNLSSFYQSFLSILPPWMQTFVNLFLLVLIVFIYAIFVWKIHKLVAKKNIIELNLRQYNKSEHPFLSRLFGAGLYFLEYIIILPFFIFIWFAAFTLFVILLSEDIPVSTLLLISAVIVGSIRMTAYYRENLSRELAKLLPLNLLAVAMIKSGFMSFDRIFNQFSQLQSSLSSIPMYLAFIIIIEVILRAFDILFSLFEIEELDEDEIEEEKTPKPTD